MHDIAVSVLIFEAAVCALVIRYRISGNLALHARDVEVEGRAAKRQGRNAVEWVCAVFGDAVNVELHLIGQRVGGGRRTIGVRHACAVFGCPCEAVIGDHAVGELRVPELSIIAHRVSHGEAGGYALINFLKYLAEDIVQVSCVIGRVCFVSRACNLVLEESLCFIVKTYTNSVYFAAGILKLGSSLCCCFITIPHVGNIAYIRLAVGKNHRIFKVGDSAHSAVVKEALRTA